MAEATFLHFSNTMGSSGVRYFTVDIDFLDPRLFDINDLEQPFSKDKIWKALKRLPKGKAPSLDGFM